MTTQSEQTGIKPIEDISERHWNKFRFDTEERAKWNKKAKKIDVPFDYYHCEWCDGYHRD